MRAGPRAGLRRGAAVLGSGALVVLGAVVLAPPAQAVGARAVGAGGDGSREPTLALDPRFQGALLHALEHPYDELGNDTAQLSEGLLGRPLL